MSSRTGFDQRIWDAIGPIAIMLRTWMKVNIWGVTKPRKNADCTTWRIRSPHKTLERALKGRPSMKNNPLKWLLWATAFETPMRLARNKIKHVKTRTLHPRTLALFDVVALTVPSTTCMNQRSPFDCASASNVNKEWQLRDDVQCQDYSTKTHQKEAKLREQHHCLWSRSAKYAREA